MKTTSLLRFLDVGSHCVYVPWVTNVEGVEQAAQAVEYWPTGTLGLAGTRAVAWVAKGASCIPTGTDGLMARGTKSYLTTVRG